MSRFTETLIVTPLPDGKTWIILADFGYDVGEEGSSDVVNVQIGTYYPILSDNRLFSITQFRSYSTRASTPNLTTSQNGGQL